MTLELNLERKVQLNAGWLINWWVPALVEERWMQNNAGVAENTATPASLPFNGY